MAALAHRNSKTEIEAAVQKIFEMNTTYPVSIAPLRNGDENKKSLIWKCGILEVPGDVVLICPFSTSLLREALAARLGLLPFQRNHLSSRPVVFRRDVVCAHHGLGVDNGDARASIFTNGA